MPELMENGFDFSVRQERGIIVHWRCEIADQVRNRCSNRAVFELFPIAGTIHPSAGALAGACIQVGIKARNDVTVFVRDVEKPNIGVPNRGFSRRDADSEELFRKTEQTG